MSTNYFSFFRPGITPPPSSVWSEEEVCQMAAIIGTICSAIANGVNASTLQALELWLTIAPVVIHQPTSKEPDVLPLVTRADLPRLAF